MEKNPMGSVMLETDLNAKLEEDIKLPVFYDKLAEFKGYELR